MNKEDWQKLCKETFIREKPAIFFDKKPYWGNFKLSKPWVSKSWDEIDEVFLSSTNDEGYLDFNDEAKAYYLASIINVTTSLLGNSEFYPSVGGNRARDLTDFITTISHLVFGLSENKPYVNFLNSLSRSEINVFLLWLNYLMKDESLTSETIVSREVLEGAIKNTTEIIKRKFESI